MCVGVVSQIVQCPIRSYIYTPHYTFILSLDFTSGQPLLIEYTGTTPPLSHQEHMMTSLLWWKRNECVMAKNSKQAESSGCTKNRTRDLNRGFVLYIQ